MRDLRENLNWIIGSAIAGTAAFLSWMWESELLSTLIGIVIGASIAYFVQTKTQKRAWRREYSVRIAEEVYGLLFGAIKSIILPLENKRYRGLDFQAWQMIQDDHRYFMVEEKFRTRLDNLLERVQRYSNAIFQLRQVIIPKIANEETERVFNLGAIEHATLEVQYKKKHDNKSARPNIINCLVSEIHPKDYALRNESEISNVKFDIRFQKVGGGYFHSHELAKFDEFWKSCLRRMKKDETYKFIIDENAKLFEEAKRVKKEIIRRIEEPWKI